MAWYRTGPKQLPKPMATQFTDAYLSLDSDKWNDKRWLLLVNTRWHGNAFYITLICTWINGWINYQHKTTTTLTTQCFKATSSDRHGVSITGQSNVCSTVCSDCQQRNIKGPRYCPFVRRIHCDQWFPTQMESNMENTSIWWRHNGLKDTMTAHVSYYALYTLHYSQ